MLSFARSDSLRHDLPQERLVWRYEGRELGEGAVGRHVDEPGAVQHEIAAFSSCQPHARSDLDFPPAFRPEIRVDALEKLEHGSGAGDCLVAVKTGDPHDFGAGPDFVSGDFADARFGRLAIPSSVGGVSALVHAGLLLLCQGEIFPVTEKQSTLFLRICQPHRFLR